jgi:hypothetical protein
VLVLWSVDAVVLGSVALGGGGDGSGGGGHGARRQTEFRSSLCVIYNLAEVKASTESTCDPIACLLGVFFV